MAPLYAPSNLVEKSLTQSSQIKPQVAPFEPQDTPFEPQFAPLEPQVATFETWVAPCEAQVGPFFHSQLEELLSSRLFFERF